MGNTIFIKSYTCIYTKDMYNMWYEIAAFGGVSVKNDQLLEGKKRL